MNYNFDQIIDRTHTASLKHDVKAKYCGNPDALSMWVADMDFYTGDFILEALQQRINHGILGYTVKTDSFYYSIINWMNKQFDWTVERNSISLTTGVVPALNFAVMAFSEPGDQVIVQSPVYAPFYKAVKNFGRELLLNPLKNTDGRYSMDLDHLQSIITPRTKLLMLSSPHNPSGRVWTKNELLALGEICLKNNIIIASDEIHSDLVYPGYKHYPIASLSPQLADITVTFMAPSKTFNVAGLATSVFIASNPGLRKKFNQLPDIIEQSNANLFGLIALEAAYTHGQDWLRQLMLYLDGNKKLVEGWFASRIPQIKVSVAEATFLLWLDCRALNLTEAELHQFFYHKANVALSRGTDFGPGGEGFMRMNIGCPRSVVEQALRQIEAAL
jgi:cystathionine beta-lyase